MTIDCMLIRLTPSERATLLRVSRGEHFRDHGAHSKTLRSLELRGLVSHWPDADPTLTESGLALVKECTRG